jgi:hypothetical protein
MVVEVGYGGRALRPSSAFMAIRRSRSGKTEEAQLETNSTQQGRRMEALLWREFSVP